MSETAVASIVTKVEQVERPEPIVRADAVARLMFERRNIPEMARFLADFGFVSPRDLAAELSLGGLENQIV